jgi:hypothetical protein
LKIEKTRKHEILQPEIYPMLYALCFLKSTILNPLDYGGEDGNTFLKWVEAHTTAIE